MSLLPFYDPFFRPSRLANQQFGLGLDPEDLLSPILPLESAFRSPLLGYYRPWSSVAAAQDAGSTVSFDKDKFQVNLDVQHFSPNEITVRTKGDNTIEIEGKHEEKQDGHGYISRHFVRRYVLPKGHDINQVQTNLSSDGVLTISAPKTGDGAQQQRNIPIQHTGKPSKPVEHKSK